jgi:hypothetical protein
LRKNLPFQYVEQRGQEIQETFLYNPNKNCFNPFLHEHIMNNGRFHWKPSDTSSNCYKTKKNAAILMKLGINFDCTIASVTACSNLNFLLPWQRGDVSNCKNHYFALFFPSKLISKCCNFSSKRLFSVGNTLPYDRPEAIFTECR